MKKKFIEIATDNIERDGLDKLLYYLSDSDFFTAPASTKYHGSYEGGLVKHSLNVFEMLSRSPFLEKASKESIAIVSLFHDICKADTYVVDYRNVKNESGQWERIPYYTVKEKFPFGHGEKSVFLISKFVCLTNEEALAINWHMGGFDQRVQGGSYSAGEAFNKSVLSLELHLADMRATYISENNDVGGK